jgi:toxin FitB
VIILDTDVLSALMRERPEPLIEQWLDRQPREAIWTSSVTILEIRFGLALMPLGRRRTGLQQEFEAVVGEDLEGRIIPFDAAAAEATAKLMAARRQSGRTGDLTDSMIAGIAIARRARLATRNIRHFDDLPVPVVNPWAD